MLNQHMRNATIVVALYVLSFQVVTYLIDPIQRSFVVVDYASLLFLPHGIRVLTVVFYGVRDGFAYLLVASSMLLFLSDEGIKTDLTVLLQTVASAGSVPLAAVLLRFGFGHKTVSLDHVTPNSWRAILMLIILSSLLNGIMQTAAIQLGSTEMGDILLSIKYMVGDILGAILVFAFASYALRKTL